MEKSLDSHIEEVLSEHGVIGVVCADESGLSLVAKGTGSAAGAGLIHNLVDSAKKIYPELDTQPVVCLESDACNLLIKSHNNVTVAIHKVPS